MSRRLSILLPWLMLGIFASGVTAQNPGPLVTDRPDQTESTNIVPRGMAQLETGWTFTRDVEGGATLEMHEVPQVLLRLGVASRLEARVGFAGWVRSETTFDVADAIVPSPGGGAQDGVGDLDVGFKYRLLDGGGGRPEVAFITTVVLPTGQEAVGAEKVDPSFRLALAHDLHERVSLGYNVGAAFTTTDRSAGVVTDSDLFYTVAFGFSLTERVGAFAESFGTFALNDRRADDHSLDGGFTFLVRDNLQFDVAGGLGLNDAAGDWFVGAGVAVRMPR